MGEENLGVVVVVDGEGLHVGGRYLLPNILFGLHVSLFLFHCGLSFFIHFPFCHMILLLTRFCWKHFTRVAVTGETCWACIK